MNLAPAVNSLGRVAVLYGGLSAEREISILSGTGVLRALRARGVDAHGVDLAIDGFDQLTKGRFARAFIALHGRFGEDGTIQGVLEWMGIPYTGSGVMASAIAMDKVFTKHVWESLGLSTPRYLVLDRTSVLHTVPETLGLPFIIKPSHEGSTLGVSKVESSSDVNQAYAMAAEFDEAVMAEEFIPGRELTVGILGAGAHARALPIIEIVAPAGNYDYENKYFTNATRYLCPAPLDEKVAKDIQELAVLAFNAIGCEGWGRVDVMLRHSDGRPFLLEVNTSPGMTGHSLVPMAALSLGQSYEDLCLEILTGASLKIKRTTTTVAARSSHVE